MDPLDSASSKVGKPTVEPTHPKRVKALMSLGKPAGDAEEEDGDVPVAVPVGPTVSPSELVVKPALLVESSVWVSVGKMVSPWELVVKPALFVESPVWVSVGKTVSPSELVVAPSLLVSVGKTVWPSEFVVNPALSVAVGTMVSPSLLVVAEPVSGPMLTGGIGLEVAPALPLIVTPLSSASIISPLHVCLNTSSYDSLSPTGLVVIERAPCDDDTIGSALITSPLTRTSKTQGLRISRLFFLQSVQNVVTLAITRIGKGMG